MMKNYDVAIIGAGPAGLFAADYILKNSNKATVALIDKGKAVEARQCCDNCCICVEKDRCSVLCGVGGSGLFSDGKLVLNLHSGGTLDAVSVVTEKKRRELIETIVGTLRKYDGKSEHSLPITEEQQKYWEALCATQGLKIKHYDVLHMGTANLHHITDRFVNKLRENQRISVKLNCEIIKVTENINGQSVLQSLNGDALTASYVIFSVGKTGSEWLKKLFGVNQIHLKKTNTYLGVRIETPNTALKELFRYSFDPKIWAYYGKRKVKTHCFCRRGDIVFTNYMGYQIVGGHTRFTKKNHVPVKEQSSKANFNVLVSTSRNSGDVYGLLNKFLEINSKGAVVQKLLEFLDVPEKEYINNNSDTSRIGEGNIRKILDEFDSTGKIISDFILRLSKIVPGILCEESKVYAPALEWFMDSVEVDYNMETTHRGWFAVGDGAGLSQGIVHSAATSLIAAEEICRRIKN